MADVLEAVAVGAQAEVDAQWEAYWREKMEAMLHAELIPAKKPDEGVIKHFVAWCAQDGISHRPCAPSVIAAYLLSRVQDDLEAGKRVSPAKFKRIVSALRSYHHLWDLADPTETPIVRAAMKLIRGRARNLQPSKKELHNGKSQIHKNNR
jgi:hypothetical protein